MNIVVLLFDRPTALDAIGPYEILQRLPGAELQFVAERAGPVRTDEGRLALVADASLHEVGAADILLVPGGYGTREASEVEPLLAWLREVSAGATWTASVCTGSLLLGAAGLLDGRRATTHWAFLDRLADHGATPVRERVVFDGRFVTAAGVSAGIDMALQLAAEVAGASTARAIQVGIEYDPRPPFPYPAPGTETAHMPGPSPVGSKG